jgi:hypothetical protein
MWAWRAKGRADWYTTDEHSPEVGCKCLGRPCQFQNNVKRPSFWKYPPPGRHNEVPPDGRVLDEDELTPRSKLECFKHSSYRRPARFPLDRSHFVPRSSGTPREETAKPVDAQPTIIRSAVFSCDVSADSVRLVAWPWRAPSLCEQFRPESGRADVSGSPGRTDDSHYCGSRSDPPLPAWLARPARFAGRGSRASSRV